MDDKLQKTELLLKYLEADRKTKDILFQLSEDADKIYSFVYRLKKAYSDEEGDAVTACTNLITQTPIYNSIKQIGGNLVRLVLQLKRLIDLKSELDPLLSDNGN